MKLFKHLCKSFYKLSEDSCVVCVDGELNPDAPYIMYGDNKDSVGLPVGTEIISTEEIDFPENKSEEDLYWVEFHNGTGYHEILVKDTKENIEKVMRLTQDPVWLKDREANRVTGYYKANPRCAAKLLTWNM